MLALARATARLIEHRPKLSIKPMSTAFNQPPVTLTEPIVDVVHGTEISDPYRWLEDQNTARTREWIKEQSQYAGAYFNAIPERHQIGKRVAELLATDVISDFWNVNDRYFFLKRNRSAEQPSIMMRVGPFGNDQLLIDPALRHTGMSTSVDIVAISRTGRFLAYSVRHGGTDYCAVEILDMVTDTVLRDGLPKGFCNGIAFSPDGAGFYYSHRRLHDPRPNRRAVFFHTFGTSSEDDRKVFFAGDDSNLLLGILDSPDSATLIFTVLSATDRLRTSVYFTSFGSDSAPKQLLKSVEGYFSPFFIRNRLLACTDVAAPNRRIVEIDFARPAPESWRNIIPETNRRIQQFAASGDRIFVTRVDRFSTVIENWTIEGHRAGPATFPRHGTIRLLNRTRQGTKLFFSHTSVDRAPTIYCFDPGSEKLLVWRDRDIACDTSDIFVEEVSYTSKDGTSIPLFLAARTNLRNSGPLPTFLTGYGGFGTCVTPRFTAFATFLLEHGFLFAVAALRGGAELGAQWHSSGTRENRLQTFADFIGAAEWLVGNGRSAPDRIAIGGGSNAGLLVGAMIVQRPDLFRAAICLGPLLDMLRYHRFDSASRWAHEYGSPDNETDFQILIRYSPYHCVKKGVSYPAVLMISGDADTRCNPMHARKMVARLQEASTSGNPVLLDYREAWGHTPVQPLSTRIDALTNRLAFICRELNIDIH